MENKYKLYNTDGKTFFDFRSNPDSRCEGFTVSYLDDGTVVMSGDYGTLCWKRNYHHAGDKDFRRDYGFPSMETGIGYFDEKVSQWGVKQKVKEFNLHYFIENLRETYGEEEKWDECEENMRSVEDNDQFKAYDVATRYFTDAWECSSEKYTKGFNGMFEKLKSVSNQIWEAVNKNDKNNN